MWCTIFSGTIFCFKSSPISRILPRVLSFTRRSLSLRSISLLGSVICLISDLSVSAPSKASWQLFKRILLKVISFPSGSSDGKEGSFSLSSEHRRAYIGQNVGSNTALSNINDITPCMTNINTTTSKTATEEHLQRVGWGVGGIYTIDKNLQYIYSGYS